ncbi:MAG: GNAT family N-acetyltransferase [Facklamia hominis]
MLEIKETRIEDIKNVQKLWANGDVMKFVGFPDGLHKTDEDMQKWFRWIESNRTVLNHYSIFEDGKYCGESFYAIDAGHKSAAMDIKLFELARGRGIATEGLSYAIKEAFRNGAEIVWVDPNPENKNAIALYERLGFQQKEFPKILISYDEELRSIYLELCKTDFIQKSQFVKSGSAGTTIKDGFIHQVFIVGGCHLVALIVMVLVSNILY